MQKALKFSGKEWNKLFSHQRENHILKTGNVFLYEKRGLASVSIIMYFFKRLWWCVFVILALYMLK
jgi:hypothetical protein